MATFEEARQVKQKHALALLKTPGVCGVDVQRNEAGDGVICVHLDDDQGPAAYAWPAQLEGVPIEYLRTGPFQKQAD